LAIRIGVIDIISGMLERSVWDAPGVGTRRVGKNTSNCGEAPRGDFVPYPLHATVNYLHRGDAMNEVDNASTCEGGQRKREYLHLKLIDDAEKGLADVAAGKVKPAATTLADITRRRESEARLNSTGSPAT